MNCQKCKCWEEMYERSENERRALAAELSGADAVIKNLKARTNCKTYYARIPATGWFVRVPRWLYNRWPWGGNVDMREASDRRSNAKVSHGGDE